MFFASAVRAIDKKIPNERFPDAFRLNHPTDYVVVFRRSRRFSGAGYTLLVAANGRSTARLGLAISKKCARHAVQRNRLKRIARESFRRVRFQLPPVDIVIQCAKGAMEIPNPRLRETLRRAWANIEKMRWDGLSSR